MKTIIRYIRLLPVVMLPLASACEDFLEVEQKTQITSDNYFINEESIMESLTAAYSALGDVRLYSNHYWKQRGLLTDHVETPETAAEFTQHYIFEFGENSGELLGMWSSLYKGINRTNTVTSKVPEELKDQELMLRAQDEARFLRALYYFHLLQMWREVPLRTPENMITFAIPKSSREEVYAFIEDDLTSIVTSNHLPEMYSNKENEEIGRATIGAAKALLGKVYLYQKKYTEAAKFLKEVIDMPYSLVPDPEYIWHINNQNNAIANENIFEVQFDSHVGGVNFWFDDGVQASEGQQRVQFLENMAGGYYNLFPTQPLIDLYQSESGDKRFKAFIRMPGDSIAWSEEVYTGLGPVIRKGISTKPTVTGGNDENFPLIRLADVYLMYAEALLNGAGAESDAVTYIDMVRERAFGNSFVSIADRKTATGKPLITLLKEERSKELAFEAHRFNDLRRWGDLETALGDRYKARGEFYPIPVQEVDKSGGILLQDPNYN
ncbi:RagB/SusD family nutrient uptake outer membrane protein [Limibacter armeniacum]|uniref:RagB/SusD family nutrient uptake outer membrane protein n=1 Tax=Limibacter armeniacum TaxID=466084 RepID=UPI002FE57C2E